MQNRKKPSSVFKLNFFRLFTSKLMLISLLFACILSIMQPFFLSGPVYDSNWNYPSSVFCKWIGGEFYSFPGQLLYTLLPIIAMLPFGVQFFLDNKSGYIKNLMIRKSKFHIIISYYFTTFYSAFIVCVLPFFVNLFINAAIYPSLLPQASSGSYRPLFRGIGVSLFYSHPYVYSSLYIIFIGVFMSLLACVGLAASLFFKNAFLVLIFPFILYFSVTLFTNITNNMILNPLYFIQPTQTQNTPLSIYFLFLSLMVIICIPFAIWQVKKRETY